MNVQPKHLKGFWNKKNILLVSLCLLFTIGLGVTTAWLTGFDGNVDYTFQGVEVPCQMVNSYNNAAVQNNGNIGAYIRATTVVNYRLKIKDGDGNTTGYGALHPQGPVSGVDYTITYNTADWIAGADDYYYYKYPVAPGGTTSNLVTGVTLKDGSGVPPTNHELLIEYLCEAIQSDPNGQAVIDAWGATLDGNNYITGVSGIE